MNLKPLLLQEATLTLPGDSILEWLAELEKGAVAAAAAVLPPVAADATGRFPEQYARLIDISAESVVLCFRQYRNRGEDWRGEDHAYRVPYTSTEQGISFGTPEPVLLVMKLVVQPAEVLGEEIAQAIAELKTSTPNLEGARKLLERTSGRHPAAAGLALALSAATR